MLVVLEDLDWRKRREILARIREALGEDHPFEIHLITEMELEWYRRFAKRLVEI